MPLPETLLASLKEEGLPDDAATLEALQIHGHTMKRGHQLKMVGFCMQMCALFSVRILFGMEMHHRTTKVGMKTLEKFVRHNFPGEPTDTILRDFQESSRLFRPVTLPSGLVVSPWEELWYPWYRFQQQQALHPSTLGDLVSPDLTFGPRVVKKHFVKVMCVRMTQLLSASQDSPIASRFNPFRRWMKSAPSFTEEEALQKAEKAAADMERLHDKAQAEAVAEQQRRTALEAERQQVLQSLIRKKIIELEAQKAQMAAMQKARLEQRAATLAKVDMEIASKRQQQVDEAARVHQVELDRLGEGARQANEKLKAAQQEVERQQKGNVAVDLQLQLQQQANDQKLRMAEVNTAKTQAQQAALQAAQTVKDTQDKIDKLMAEKRLELQAAQQAHQLAAVKQFQDHTAVQAADVGSEEPSKIEQEIEKARRTHDAELERAQDLAAATKQKAEEAVQEANQLQENASHLDQQVQQLERAVAAQVQAEQAAKLASLLIDEAKTNAAKKLIEVQQKMEADRKQEHERVLREAVVTAAEVDTKNLMRRMREVEHLEQQQKEQHIIVTEYDPACADPVFFHPDVQRKLAESDYVIVLGVNEAQPPFLHHAALEPKECAPYNMQLATFALNANADEHLASTRSLPPFHPTRSVSEMFEAARTGTEFLPYVKHHQYERDDEQPYLAWAPVAAVAMRPNVSDLLMTRIQDTVPRCAAAYSRISTTVAATAAAVKKQQPPIDGGRDRVCLGGILRGTPMQRYASSECMVWRDCSWLPREYDGDFPFPMDSPSALVVLMLDPVAAVPVLICVPHVKIGSAAEQRMYITRWTGAAMQWSEHMWTPQSPRCHPANFNGLRDDVRSLLSLHDLADEHMPGFDSVFGYIKCGDTFFCVHVEQLRAAFAHHVVKGTYEHCAL